MMQPLVSIHMITYNHAPYIAQAIEGVLRQETNFQFELVIGEDHSSDGTREIVLEYVQRHGDIIREITSDRNVGAKRNTLRTLKACQGRYIAFCEGDDYWHHPHKLRKQVDYLENHPECGLVFTDYDFHYDRAGKVVRMVNQDKGFRSPMNLTIEQAIGPEGGVIRTCTVMARRELLERVIEGDPYLHQDEKFLMADLQLFAELTQITEVSYFPESLATYRILDESATRSRDPIKTARFCKSACEIKLYLCDKYKLSEDIRRKMEADWCDSALRLAFHARDEELADEVRRRANTFTWKEWLKYLGAKNRVVNRLVRLPAILGNGPGRSHRRSLVPDCGKRKAQGTNS